jgi:hypothetical protein
MTKQAHVSAGLTEWYVSIPSPKHFKLVNTAQETCSVLTVWQGDKMQRAVTTQGRFTTFVRNKIIRHARSTLEAEVMSLFGFKFAEGNSSVRQLQYVLRKASLVLFTPLPW